MSLFRVAVVRLVGSGREFCEIFVPLEKEIGVGVDFVQIVDVSLLHVRE